MRIRPATLVAIALASVARSSYVCAQSAGADVIVGEVAGDGDDDIWRFTTVGGVTAYSFRTVACNIGDREIAWDSASNQHPVISQNMFRLMNGRFEQIGQAWVKHGFATENEQFCGTCIPTDGTTLGVGCSDPYYAILNGQQALLGPKSQVNASKGFFLFPFSAPAAPPGIGRRLQVHDTDLNPALNPGALYYLEAEYITPDDAFWGNSWNNASWRQVTFTPTSPYEGTVAGPTYQQEPAILAWVYSDPSVEFVFQYVPDDGDVGYNGYYGVAGKATYLGGCQWHYEYAVENMNSFQSAAKFTVDLPDGVTITNIGFHDVDYHSGEPYSGADWPATVSANSITWATQTFAQNVNANALRWATLYNYRFDADAPPNCYGNATVGLFRTPTRSFSVSIVAPRAGIACYRSGDIDKDCDVDGDDFAAFMTAFGLCQGDGAYDVEADMNADGCIDLVDYQDWLARYREYINDPQAEPPPFGISLPGDFNGDSIVDQIDVMFLVNVLIGVDTNINHVHACDMDGDGFTNGRDISFFTSAMLLGG